ncbi:MAG: hypothetical protein GYB33_11325 [Gammaproteobacteria bacterium]|nr:hypothetical protein [Gammaproteobacteria bacterium]
MGDTGEHGEHKANGREKGSVASSRSPGQLGVLGLGSRSTLFYIEQLNAGYNRKFGGDSTCPLILLNSNFDEFNRNLPDKWLDLEPALKNWLQALAHLSVAQIIIPNITLHECYDRLQGDLALESLNIIHPVSRTIEQLQQSGCDRIVLFGSHYSMQSPALTKQFTESGIAIIRPQPGDICAIDTLRQRVYCHKETAQELGVFDRLLTHYSELAPVVIACTELSVALSNSRPDIFDMARVQIDQALQGIVCS